MGELRKAELLERRFMYGLTNIVASLAHKHMVDTMTSL